ncbi:quinolinate synthase NadA [Haladaptatus pallidirubidus]|nr:quinolinate synthase NadA [Haladaptatus pallidirubidus]
MESINLETELSLFKYDSLEQLPEEYRELSQQDRTERIERSLDRLGDSVVILGHNYQRREIVEHADFVGDSYQLSAEAANADAEYVLFCGVTFMAESADIITDDDQTVILPSMEASCPMAGMAEALQVDSAWGDIESAAPDADIVPITYMNSYADLKAFCAEQGGAVCTSSNAHRVFEWALERGDKILFLPDKHLGENTAHRLGLEDGVVEWNPWNPGEDANDVADVDIILWDGYCQVHERFTTEHVEQVRDDYPDARVVVHPECRREVVESADVVGSTATIRETVADADPGETWAVGTEIHLVHHLQRWHPEASVVPLCGDACMDCNAMQQTDPNYLTWVLEELVAGRERNVIEVPPEEKELATLALNRMLEL